MVSAGTRTDRATVERLVRQVMRERWHAGGSAPASSPAPAPAAPAPVPAAGAPPAAGGGGEAGAPNPLVVNVSARHVHVTPGDLETLFGPGSRLTKKKDLYQEGEFASDQTVNIVGPRNRMIPDVRILGPVRDYTQVELSYTDGVFLGLDLPLRISGNHEGTPGCILVGPAGALNLEQGVIRAERHVHMHPRDAAHYGVSDGDAMKLRVDGPCGLVFDRVKVRVNEKVKLEVHIDTDEGNACHLPSAHRITLET